MILNIMEKLSNKKGITFNLTLQPNLEDESQCRSLLTVYANMLNKKQCFQTIAESAKQSIKPEQASILVQTLWDMHKASRTHGCSWNRLYNSISFCNGIISKRIDINSTAQSFEFKNIIQNAQLKKQQNMLGQTIYTKSSLSDKALIKKLKIITDGINDTFIVNENDEFSNLNPRREFVDNLKAEPNGVIIETNEHDKATIQQGEDQR